MPHSFLLVHTEEYAIIMSVCQASLLSIGFITKRESFCSGDCCLVCGGFLSVKGGATVAKLNYFNSATKFVMCDIFL